MDKTHDNAFVTKTEPAELETRTVERIAQLERRMFGFGITIALVVIAAIKYLP